MSLTGVAFQGPLTLLLPLLRFPTGSLSQGREFSTALCLLVTDGQCASPV